MRGMPPGTASPLPPSFPRGEDRGEGHALRPVELCNIRRSMLELRFRATLGALPIHQKQHVATILLLRREFTTNYETIRCPDSTECRAIDNYTCLIEISLM